MRRRLTVSVGLEMHPQIGQGVLDLLALVEAGAANHLVGQPDPDEHLLDRPALRVGAIEDRDVLGFDPVLVAEPVDASARRRTPRRARCPRHSRRCSPRRPSRSTGSSVAGRGCGRSRRWPRAGWSGSSGSSAPAGWSAHLGSPARTRRCCGSSPPGRHRSTGPRRRRPRARPAAPTTSTPHPSPSRMPSAHLSRVALSQRSSPHPRPALAPTDIARCWCPGIRPPAHAGTAAGSAPRRPGTTAADGRSS
jgi:hypothetical protein